MSNFDYIFIRSGKQIPLCDYGLFLLSNIFHIITISPRIYTTV